MKYVFLLMGILVGLFWSEIYREFSRMLNTGPLVSQSAPARTSQPAPKPAPKPEPAVADAPVAVRQETVQSDPVSELSVYSDKASGFLVKHPYDWIARPTGQGIAGVEIVSGSRLSRVVVRLHAFRGREAEFLTGFKSAMTERMHRFPQSPIRSFVDGSATHDLTGETRESGQRYSLHDRAMFFPDEGIVATMESRCPVEMGASECLMAENVIRSFWVYNRDKLAKLNPVARSMTFSFN